MNTKPSPDLPPWALRYFERQRDRFDDMEMPHRREAFYRLLCSNDPDMRRMWAYVNRRAPADSESGGAFLATLIYSMDDADDALVEQVPRYPRPPDVPEKRLRDPAQRQARKLARLLREFGLVTPPRCEAFHADVRKDCGSTIERLVIFYHFELAPRDVNEIWRRHGIEYTSSSKRGWIQSRRASDTVRARAIEAALKLAQVGRPNDAAWLGELAEALQRLPDFEIEHAGQPELYSQKCGWPDWLRVVRDHLQFEDGNWANEGLRVVDWTALVRALFVDVDVTEVRVGQVLKEKF